MGVRIARVLTAALLGLALIPTGAGAEQFQEYGDYIVHYNIINTSFLSADVAREYGIRRSGSRAMLNIAVQKKGDSGTTPVRAEMAVSATNLNGQLREVPVRALEDRGAIYYIGEFAITDGEVLDFDVRIRPEDDTAQPLNLRFREQFFVR